jgi:hypothetical protein
VPSRAPQLEDELDIRIAEIDRELFVPYEEARFLCNGRSGYSYSATAVVATPTRDPTAAQGVGSAWGMDSLVRDGISSKPTSVAGVKAVGFYLDCAERGWNLPPGLGPSDASRSRILLITSNALASCI